MKKIFLLTIAFAKFINAYTQNVGIGTATPSLAKFEVHGVPPGSGKTNAIIGGDLPGVSFQRDLPTIGYNQYRPVSSGFGRYISTGYAAAQHLDPSAGNLNFDLFTFGAAENAITFSKRLLSLNSSGRVSIGDASHNSTLTVSKGTGGGGSTANFWGSMHSSIFNSGSAENTHIRAGKDGGTLFINDIVGGKVSMTGFVGINTSTPVYPLELRQAQNGGRGLLLVEENTFANWEWLVLSDGNLHLNYGGGIGKGYFKRSNGSYNTFSDRRLKRNIEALPSLLDKFMQLQPVSYQMKDDKPGQKKSIGFIAQEVRKLFPELVTVASDSSRLNNGITNLHMLDYDGFNVITIKVIQEQQAIIKKQSQDIAAIRARLNHLKSILARLQ